MIYFDNSATTKPCVSAVSAVNRALTEVFGNPSSRQTLSAALHAEPESVYFTSGGTLSDNIAILGGAKSGIGMHAVTTAIEHDAVLGCFKTLEARGFEVTYINPREDGNIHIEDISAALRKNTCLVSIAGGTL